jgi:glycosyltransferase involved in cell wall biosynthesis
MSSISVVIPVYNDAELLRRCLRALAEQSRLADEIVVVDNGSTDDSAEVARAAGARVVVEARRGIAPASSAGFDAARGDILARLDADSVPAADWLSRIESRFEASPQLSGLTGPADFIDGTPAARWMGRVAYLGGYFSVLGLLLGHPPFFGSNLALRSSAWARLRTTAHRSSATVHDDLDLSFQVPPGMVVEYDDQLGMRISSRPFDSALSFAYRSWRGVATILINLPRRLGRSRAERFSLPPAPSTTGALPVVPPRGSDAAATRRSTP